MLGSMRLAATGLALLALAGSACTSVVVPDVSKGGAGGSVMEPPSGLGGAAPTGGSAGTGGAGGEGAGGATSEPTNPDPACIPQMILPTGTPLAIGSGMVSPARLALAGDDVYVTELGAGPSLGSLVRVPKTGGEIERVVSDQDEPGDVEASADEVYWLSGSNLHHYALTDGSSGIVQNLLAGAWDIALHGGSIYVTEAAEAQIVVLGASGEVDEIPTGLVPNAIGVDDSGSYVTSHVPDGGYWILRVESDGEVSYLYNGDFNVTSPLLVDDGYLYLGANWGFAPAEIVRGTVDGAPLVTIASVPGPTDSAVVADCFVYFTSHDQGEVARVPLQGGEVQVLASGQLGPRGIAVDAEAIYWVNGESGTLMRLQK